MIFTPAPRCREFFTNIIHNGKYTFFGRYEKYRYKFEYKPKRKDKYGYIEFVDKHKLKNNGYDDNIEPELRKPTPAEREEIILNFIRANSGQPVFVWLLAEKLGVSDRTIQKILKNLRNKGSAFHRKGQAERQYPDLSRQGKRDKRNRSNTEASPLQLA